MSKGVIFFDFDGTILNSFSLYFKTTQHLFPQVTVGQYRDIFKQPDFNQSNIIRQENKEEFFSLIEKHSHLYDIYPGVMGGLKDLARDYHLVIVTAAPKAIVKYQLSRFGLPWFHRIYGYEKPGNKMEKIKHYCDHNGRQTRECFFVTDTLGDLLQVAPLGLQTIAVTHGFHDRPTLQQGQPGTICHNFDDIVWTIRNKKTA